MAIRFPVAWLKSWGIPLALIAAATCAVIVFWPRREANTAGGGIWTCSMHPPIRMDHPGRCPICGMDLIPVKEVKAETKTGQDEHAGQFPARLELSEHARMMARVGTTKVQRRPLFHELRTVGKIDFDETRMKQIASRIKGRVDQVFADFPGTQVKQGDHLVSIYSPDLVSTQEEFLSAARREQGQRNVLPNLPSLSQSARRRLQLWGITDEQIDDILRRGQADTHLTVFAPIGGTVIEKMVRAGKYVEEGETLYTIADLGHIWLILEIFESDLPWVKFGQQVQVTLESDPAASFTGQVGFVEPVLNEQTRTVRVRVILRNDERKLKPGMFAQALIRVQIMPGGGPAPTGLEGKFVCTMHPYIVSEQAANCSVCEMPLEKVPGEPAATTEPPAVLAVPAEAVLTTGRRQLVYVEQKPGVYQLVEPHLGSRAGDYYPVLHGLNEGDAVVSRGSFLLDSQFQISGKASLLYPDGIGGGGSGHAGHGMETKAKGTQEHKP